MRYDSLNNHCTHVIQCREEGKRAVLSRREDGMVIAVRVTHTVAWGEDPRQQVQRIFVDAEHAHRFLRVLADLDTRAQDGAACDAKAALEEVDDDSRVLTPMGGGRTQ